MDATDLRIHLLGELTATRGGAPLDLGGPRQRAVLAVLLLARGEVVPAERLAESVWGTTPPANVAGALQSYVSHLRRRLEPGSAARARSGLLVSEGTGYAVRLPRDAVDSWRFEALLQAAGAEEPPAAAALLEQALDLWRGPALLDYADEPWAEPEIARLSDLRAVAREQLADARLGCGEAALLVPELEAMVADEPLREQRWRLLVLALYRAHRQADALAALRRARDTLAEELGVDPGPALRALEAEVLAQSPALELPRQRVATSPSSAPAPPDPTPAAAPDDLVDRDREVAALTEALQALHAGQPQLLLIEGPAGIGKSRLVAELRTLAAARPCRVLTARGTQLEKSFGFGAVRQLFEPAVTSSADGDDLLTGAAAGARGVFDLVDAAPVDGSFAVLHGLYWLTARLAGAGPLVLVLDDLQWCDSASLRYLAYLVPRLEGLQVLVVGTVRTGEQHADEQLLAELALDPAAVVLRPEPLSAEATAGVVRQRLGEHAAPAFTDACFRTTAGNPLLLRQLLRGLESDRVPPDASHADRVLAVGSRAVSSMVLVRLRRLSPEATTVARAVAVLGEGAQLPAVAALAGLAEPDAAAALADLARAEIVRDEQPLGFVHALVRDAVHRDIPAGERALHHERAAAVLRAGGADAEHVAAQLLLAPSRGNATTVALLRAAGRRAADRGASDSAVTYLRRALEEPPDDDARPEVLLELGLAESLLDGPASAAHLAEAYPLITDPRTRGWLSIAVARTHVFASPPGVAATFARDAAEGLAPDDDARQGLVALQRTSTFMQGLDPAVWRRDPVPEPVGEGYGAKMLAAALAMEAAGDGTDRERAVWLARRALAGKPLWDVDNGLFWVVAANVLLMAGEDLGDFWQRARAQAHARGSLFAALSVNLWGGYWHWHRGDLVEAADRMRACEEQNRMWGTFLGSSYSLAFAIDIELDRGEVGAARRIVDRSAGKEVPGDGGRLLRLALVRLLLAEGRPAEALAELERADDPARIANPVWHPWRSLRARGLHALGRTEEALELLEQEVVLLRRWGSAAHLGPAVRLLGELSGGAGLSHLREAVALLEDGPAALELARARCALGSSSDVPDDEAVPMLQAALSAAHDRGALGIVDAASAALTRRGLSVDVGCAQRPARSATQRQVLDLAQAGHDADAIAQRLFLTPGTVRSVLESAGSEAS